jgi:protoporphyrinogen oxidase
MKKALIIGAGPAGLTAAYELLTKSRDHDGNPTIEVVVFEESEYMGGISKTVNHKGNRMDMGGHRFFSKIPEVNQWWNDMIPMQGAPAYDDILLSRRVPLKEGGPDPEKEDIVMLTRRRISRIMFGGHFFDYPISLSFKTLVNMGFGTTILVFFSYLKVIFHKRPEKSLEDFYINRFGKKLYSMFFENYTENLWGRHPREIDPSWGAQRTKGMSIMAIIKDIVGKMIPGNKNRKVETSLIEEFTYPKLGPGQLWDVTADKITALGGKILKNHKVTSVIKNTENQLTALTYEYEGATETMSGDYFISSMPVKDLVAGMNEVPADIAKIAAGLPYRDYMTLGVLVPKLNLINKTKHTTVSNIVPDCWIYVHEKAVQMGRFQIYNNWSPYMIRDLENTVWLGLEYFCTEGDQYWSMADEDFSRFAIAEMVTLGLIDCTDLVLDSHVCRVKKAYPAYFDTYHEMDKLIAYLSNIPNLYCIGRNGQHRYNNIDHSMCTSFETVKNILNGATDKHNIWSVNTEQDYHEEAHEKPAENEID